MPRKPSAPPDTPDGFPGAAAIPDRTTTEIKGAMERIINVQVAWYEAVVVNRPIMEEEAAILANLGRILQAFEDAERKRPPGSSSGKTSAEMITEILDGLPREELVAALKRRGG